MQYTTYIICIFSKHVISISSGLANQNIMGPFLTPLGSFETDFNLLSVCIYELGHGCYGDLKAHPNFCVVMSEIMSLGKFKL